MGYLIFRLLRVHFLTHVHGFVAELMNFLQCELSLSKSTVSELLGGNVTPAWYIALEG